MHRQIAPPIFAIALLSSVGVSLAQPPTPTTQPTGFLHPTPGETVTVGELYTISWSPPPPSPPGPLALEIKGTNAYIRPLLVNRTIGCDGYMANTHCDKFNMGIEEGETEFVWNMTDPGTERLGVRVRHGSEYRLGLYADNLARGLIPQSEAEWYWSVAFTIAEAAAETSTTMTTTTASTDMSRTASATTGTQTESVTSTTGGDVQATETGTAATSPLRMFAGWRVVIGFSLFGIMAY